ncbi:SIP domain-containing protein [Streptosporangium sp. NPDC051023]|uniref:SIP domain-containing protein n=1 Tax=Streptosporangium sp. NPDC051023 TaxID=3155410 RepID=UPI00344BA979
MQGTTWKAETYVTENSGQYQSAMEALALAAAHLHAGGRFADVGCGAGEIAAAMAEREFEVTANDASPSMVTATKARCAGLKVSAEVQDAHRLDLPREHFDVVHSSWMLHWLTDPEHAVRTMARALRPGGQLILQWSFGQPADDGFPMREILEGVIARPAWRERLAATPLAMFHHPAEVVCALLRAEGLDVELVQPDVDVPGPKDPQSLRRVTRTTAFSAQADVLGEDADAFIDEALLALFEAGQLNVHNTRVIARRPGGTPVPAARTRAFPLSVGLLRVDRVEDLTPLMRRFVFTVENQDGLPVEEPGEIITLIWPAPDASEVILPEIGRWRFPAHAGRQVTRNYTVRAYDPDRRLVTIDFFLHSDHGPASRWASGAVPGDQVGYGGTRVHWVSDPSAEWTLLAGDETALPALDAITETRPAGHPVFAVVEVRDAAERPALAAPGALITWLYRGDRPPGSSGAIEAAVRSLDLPAGRGQIWAAGESLSIQSLRRHLLEERGLGRDQVSALGYWNHPRSAAGRD